MADLKLAKWQIATIAIIILIIPLIIVFQLSKQPDIVINFDQDDPFRNKCFLGETTCQYEAIFPEIELREDDTYWWILGEDVWCVKTERTVEVPVSDPVGVITQETEISCNDLAMFDKLEWDFIQIPPPQGCGLTGTCPPLVYVFIMKGT